MDLDALRRELALTSPVRAAGRVVSVTGLALTVSLPGARVGDLLVVRRRGEPLQAEVVGFRGGEVTALPLGSTVGVGPDDQVESTGAQLGVTVGDALLGRVLDGLGRPRDGQGPVEGERVTVDHEPPDALSRARITEKLVTGVRSIDGLLTVGVGQRIGLFAGSGVGKSTLLGALARGAAADAVVVALVGERGREVRELLEGPLAAARTRSVVVVATSDSPALERVHAANVATRVAEYFRDAGRRVLLLVDSVTRVARALREVGLAAGEPPTRRGFPPSVFAALPRLMERTGQGSQGSITALYTVLVEGDDLDEPVTDEVRGLLDGHVVLSRALALRGQYPAIDVTASVSRVMPLVTDAAHRRNAETVRRLVATFEEKRDLISLGAYREGADPALDRAVRAEPEIVRLLAQPSELATPFEETAAMVERIAARHGA